MGTYNGMIQKRSYTIAIAVPANPTQILLNGVVLKNGWEFNKAGRVTINLAAKNVDKKQVIIIQ